MFLTSGALQIIFIMKKKQKKGIDLKKLTIARIDSKVMIKVRGGDCVIDDDDLSSHHSHCACGPSQHIF